MPIYPYRTHPQLKHISVPLLPLQEHEKLVKSQALFYWVPCTPKFPHPHSSPNHISHFDGMRLDYSITSPKGELPIDEEFEDLTDLINANCDESVGIRYNPITGNKNSSPVKIKSVLNNISWGRSHSESMCPAREIVPTNQLKLL